MTAPEHQAILDLLRAFGIDGEGVRAVEIQAGHLQPVQVHLERWVSDADPSQVAESYDVGSTHLRGVLGDLVDALSDDLQHEIARLPDVQRAIREAVRALEDDDAFAHYLYAWWLQPPAAGRDAGGSGVGVVEETT